MNVLGACHNVGCTYFGMYAVLDVVGRVTKHSHSTQLSRFSWAEGRMWPLHYITQTLARSQECRYSTRCGLNSGKDACQVVFKLSVAWAPTLG